MSTGDPVQIVVYQTVSQMTTCRTERIRTRQNLPVPPLGGTQDVQIVVFKARIRAVAFLVRRRGGTP